MTSILLLNHQRPDGEIDRYHLKAGRRYHLGRGSQCQVRILDLKLSRQHCAFEHGDLGWVIVDLASTNGCSVDGERVSGTRPLHAGAVVSAGTTTLAVERTLDDSEDVPAVQGPTPQMIPATPAGGTPAPWPQQGEAEPPRASDRLAAAVSRSSDQRNDLEPQSSRKDISDPLIPAPPRKPIAPVTPSVDQDVLATLAPAQRPATPQAENAESGSRTFYINVLGRRVGPLSRTQARELKTRELKGTLTPSDLAAVEADSSGLAPGEAAAITPDEQAASSDDQRTYFITVLGKRVGPLTRQQARDLKARELRGGLSADEVERFVAR
jgi:pSer/pThr/pTyr-binding forkhead associated (FHA) protein